MNINKFIYLILIIILFGCSNESDICKKYLEQGYLEVNIEHENLYKQGKLEDAISMVEELISRDSNDYISINYLGAYKYSLCQKNECEENELKEVYDLYKKSIELCDNYRLGYFNIIEVLAEMQSTKFEDDKKLIEYLELYNSRYKKRSNLMTKGGEAMFRLGKLEESLKYLNEAIKLDSTEAMAYIFKGKCYSKKKEWEEAIKNIDKGLSLDSLSLGFHERGFANKEIGNIEEAIEDYTTAILLYKKRYESYIGLGEIEVNRSNVNLACQYFNEAKKLKPGDRVVNVWLDKNCNEDK